LNKIASELKAPGGLDAANLRVAEQYVAEFGKLAKENNTLILPANAGDVGSLVAQAMATMKTVQQG
jgi:hypothetical protein